MQGKASQFDASVRISEGAAEKLNDYPVPFEDTPRCVLSWVLNALTNTSRPKD
jgi:hypothetical protein